MMQGLVQAGVTLGFQHREARRMVAALFVGSARMAEQNPAPLMQLRTLQALLRRLAQSAREYRGQGEARTGGEVEEG